VSRATGPSTSARGRLAGKVAFLAGATSGIGETTARVFAAEGARVAVAGRRVAEGEAIAAAIGAAGGEAIFVQTDVTDPPSVERSIRAVSQTFGRLDILFNNAGGSTPQDGRVTETPTEEFWRAVKLDLFGTWNCCRYGIPELIRAGGGSVINMASMVAVSPTPGRDAYTSAKGGVVALTRSMAREYASNRVRVNALAPAAVRTERVAALIETVPGARAIVDRQLLGLIEPVEVAWAAVYLAADESRTLTGQVIAIHGGAFET
jgi:NAD(P)-dependent dehydrogenase (short-subunit alcohol dehydrogenase family)